MRTRIAHLSSLHPALDVRIFHKQCRTLARAGYDVHLVVHDPPEASRDGVTFHAIPPAEGAKWTRAWQRLANTYRVARALEAEVYHFHDPELIPVGALLKQAGARVIYDVHENAPVEARTQLKARPVDAWILSSVYTAYEALARRTLDGFIGVTDDITAKFPAARRTVVANYPVLDEFEQVEHPGVFTRPHRFLYVGGISRVRGAIEMLDAAARLSPDDDAVLEVMGRTFPPDLLGEMERHPGWAAVDFRGWRERHELVPRMAGARAGLVLFHPERDHLLAKPNKLFEYMAAGLPVIASDFPLWRELVADAGCGLLVDPLDPGAIAEAIRWMCRHPEEARAMGERGRRLVRERYNWASQGERLVAFYRQLGIEPTTGTA